MDLLMSIKPEYVNKIISGEKQYELRRTIPKNNFNRVFIYCTSPVKKVVGYWIHTRFIIDSPEAIWNDYQMFLGIRRHKDFINYCKNKDEVYLYPIKDLRLFKEPFNINFSPPQSFKYIDGSDLKE